MCIWYSALLVVCMWYYALSVVFTPSDCLCPKWLNLWHFLILRHNFAPPVCTDGWQRLRMSDSDLSKTCLGVPLNSGLSIGKAWALPLSCNGNNEQRSFSLPTCIRAGQSSPKPVCLGGSWTWFSGTNFPVKTYKIAAQLNLVRTSRKTGLFWLIYGSGQNFLAQLITLKNYNEG